MRGACGAFLFNLGVRRMETGEIGGGGCSLISSIINPQNDNTACYILSIEGDSWLEHLFTLS